MLSTLSRAAGQSFRIPAPPLTEANIPDQTGRVHLVTGGYAGCGEQLAHLLYGAHATVFIAGRSQAKADAALASIRAAHPSSRGTVAFISLDLSDLRTIAPAVAAFEAASPGGRLHVLTNNAGVMMPPSGSRGAQGHELQVATNCLGPFLLTRLLGPALRRGAADDPAGRAGGVRVTWAGSLAVDLLSPRGGVEFADEGEGERMAPPKVLGRQRDYGQSKCGNLYLAAEFARRGGADGAVRHYCWNPGNLKSELQRHISFVEDMAMRAALHPARYGAYTELYAALSPDLDAHETSGRYVAPWGRLGSNRGDVEREVAAAGEGKGRAERFYRWCEQETAPYAGDEGAAKL